MQIKTIEERVRSLAKGWAYKQLVQRNEEFKKDPTNERSGLVVEACNWVNKLIGGETKGYVLSLRDSGQILLRDKAQSIEKAQEIHDQFTEAARLYLPVYVEILDKVRKFRETRGAEVAPQETQRN
ncbi:MAG: hypothetical protein WC242_01010 [Candidatus Paceibacterota bacterium]|jgi:hypothetical protein